MLLGTSAIGLSYGIFSSVVKSGSESADLVSIRSSDPVPKLQMNQGPVTQRTEGPLARKSTFYVMIVHLSWNAWNQVNHLPGYCTTPAIGYLSNQSKNPEYDHRGATGRREFQRCIFLGGLDSSRNLSKTMKVKQMNFQN